MISGKSQAGVAPYAYGSLLQAATYGVAIPIGYGLTISPLLATWTANLRAFNSNKKFKSLKKSVPAYCENISFVLAHSPVVGVNQIWNNSATIPLSYTSQAFTGPGPWTITDPHFYAVIGASVAETYNVSFDDYGGSPVTESGTYQVPLWNELMTGPDPVRNSGYRNYPYCYRWQPSYGAVIHADADDIFAGATVTVYYAQLTAATSYQTPLVRTRLHFENVLGDGDEYTGVFTGTSTPLATQQILYPMYAGIGSASLDLGSAGVIPQLQAEVQFKWGVYSTGDADFVDMIEDIFKSGLAQAAVGATTGTLPYTRLEHGLSCYSFPGCVQMKCLTAASSVSIAPIAYNMQVTEGDFLVVVAVTNGSGGGALSISDSASNSWTAVFTGTSAMQVWYTQANATCPVTVTVTGQGNNWATTLIEIAGVDTFDSVVIGNVPNAPGAASITTTNSQNLPAYLLSIGLYPGASTVSQPAIPQWTLLTPPNFYGNTPANGYSIQERPLDSPGTYTVGLPTAGLLAQCVLAFKSSSPPSNPMPVGDFFDINSLDLVRAQCRANGLYGSFSMSSQQAAADYLKTLYAAADAAPVFCGFKLYSWPYSEVSTAGNGAVYTAPTSGGPQYNLSTENGDFISQGSDPPIKVTTAARVNQPNVLQMQCLNRSSNYNPSVVQQPEQGSIALYGVRKADPIVNTAVQDVQIARKLLGIAVRNQQYNGDKYQFTLPAKWCLLAPMGIGGGGNFVQTLGFGNIPGGGLPLPAVGESVAWVIAAESGVVDTPYHTFGIPSPPYSGGATATGGLTSCGFYGRAGFLYFVTATSGWAGFSIPYGVDPTLITRILPVISSSGDHSGGNFSLGCHYMGASIISYPGNATGLFIGPDILPAIGAATNIGGVTINAELFITNPGMRGAGSVGFVGIAIYYRSLLSTPLPTVAFVADGKAVIDSLITITDPLANILKVPVRITSIKENVDETLTCEAEPFIYGMYAPTPFVTDPPVAPTSPATHTNAGSVNAPVLFEPTPALSGLPTQGEIWAAISASSAAYGGCQPYVSTDGGASYVPLGSPLVGSATTGHNTADWPAHADPDTTNDLLLDLTESNGQLASFSTVARDNFQYPCYIHGGGTYTIPYELFAYNSAVLTSAYHYTVKATGTGNALRRGVYAAPSPAIGVDHPTSSRFAFLDPSGQGIMKVTVPPAWIGTTIYFKFPTFNTFGGAVQSLTVATAYGYAFTGVPGGVGPGSGFLVNGV